MAARRLAAAAIAAWATLLMAPAVLAASPSPSPTPDPSQVCKKMPAIYSARYTCDAITGGPGAVGRDAQQTAGQAGQAVAQAGQAAVDAPETAFTSWLANGAAWVVQAVTQMVVGNSTTPSLNPAQALAFSQVYGRVVGVALSLSVLLVLVGIIEATLTQKPGGYRRVVTGIAVAGIGLGAIPVGTAILVQITDDLSSYVASTQSQEVAHGLKAVIQLLQQTPPADGGSAFALTALGLMVGGALLWLELVTRASLIYLFLGVVPLACAAVQWPRLEGVLRQVLFGGLALILSKLVITIALAVGFAVLALGSGGLQSLLGGMFIVVIAAVTPFATARVLPLAAEEMAMSHQTRVRGWAMSAVGTTASVVTAIRTGGARAPAGLPLAPAMGSSTSQSGGASGSGPGPSGRGPSPGGGGGGPDGRSGPGRPAPGRPSSTGQVASAASGSGPAAPPAGSPGPGPSPRPPDRNPPRRPRGPEPPRDGGRPPAR